MRQELIDAMLGTFGEGRGRIDHAMAVLAYAETMLESEPGDRLTVVAAAILHDIGCVEAERKHASAAHHLQELEGPPVAREILERLEVDGDVVDHVCRIVGSHHSAGDIDTPEFRIVWDADWMVNLAGSAQTLPADELARRIEQTFRTPTGRQLACERYLPG